MRVNRLEVTAFRNLENVLIEPSATANIICGDNAQGKTNLLESIWLFTGSRSFRANKEKDFIPKDKDYASVNLGFNSAKRDQEATIKWSNDKKQILVNEVKKDGASELAGGFCGVVFTPDQLSLIKDGPENRRNMLDQSLSQAYPKYNKALSSYNKALKQRNTLLKDIQFNSGLLDMLPLWDEHIINYGGYISALRSRYIKKLSAYSKEIYEGISGGKEHLSVEYIPSFGVCNLDDFGLEDFKLAIKKEMKISQKDDIRLGITGIGPHRDDLEIEIDQMSARSFASQGQQRSAILSLKLAECNILEEQIGEPPIVLLDDVMSELDNNRKSYLLNKLEGKQVFITCCDTSAFQELERGKIFFIKNGRLTDEKEV